MIWVLLKISIVKLPRFATRILNYAGLSDRLRELRNKLAKEHGVPSYKVFPNKTLEYFTRLRPKTHEAECRIKGGGEQKAVKYPWHFIDEINLE